MAKKQQKSILSQAEAVEARLRELLGSSVFDTWLKSLCVGGLKDGILTLFLPTNFFCSYIARNFADEITQAWQAENPEILRVKFEVGSPAFSEKPDSAEEPKTERPQTVSSPEFIETEKDVLSAALDPRFTFDNFVVGAPNEFAYAAARRVAESKTPSFNPLYLYSGAGLGKTHLMHSIAWYIREHDPSRRVVYLSAEKFMYLFIRAIRYKDTLAFKEELRNVDVLMIDDVQFLIGKDSTQDEFFHTFNALVGSGKQIVLSADKPPVNLEGIEERLKTRLGSGLVADIHQTTFELRVGILESKAQNSGVYVPQDVISFLAEKITSSVRELEGALLRVTAHVQLMGGEVTLERTCDILRDVLSALDRRVTIEEIQRKVAEHYNIRVAEMTSKRRDRPVARPRQIAMFLSKELTTKSLPDIGRAFDRDHTTVIHAVKAIENLREKDPAFKEETDSLRRMLSV
ncbi:MAG: chromosomal replication initiator protein DnaA [Alphaproteobacteria bacterium]|nr:chromosomal replication initiator protein DnaA [Alphaproteobacteria bacterium]